jgi:hypothetical protein
MEASSYHPLEHLPPKATGHQIGAIWSISSDAPYVMSMQPVCNHARLVD